MYRSWNTYRVSRGASRIDSRRRGGGERLLERLSFLPSEVAAAAAAAAKDTSVGALVSYESPFDCCVSLLAPRTDLSALPEEADEEADEEPALPATCS